MIALILALFASTTGFASPYTCPAGVLKCTLSSKGADKNWRVVSEASSLYTTKYIHCSARVTIASPDNPKMNFIAVASTNGDTFLFTTVSGQTDYTFYRSGVGTKAPVILENKLNQFNCTVQ